jgi:hypothetical protein
MIRARFLYLADLRNIVRRHIPDGAGKLASTVKPAGLQPVQWIVR